jgi:RNA polymerase sigma factor (sigma-70 family)
MLRAMSNASTRLEGSMKDRSRGAANRPVGARLSAEEIGHLMRSVARGHQRDWEALVREFRGVIRGVARSYRLSDDDAADVTQATWLRLLEHLDNLREPARVGAWLATTARRECLCVVRGSQRHTLVGEEFPEFLAGENAPEPSDASPGDALLVAERNMALWRSFARLSANDQALLRLLMADQRDAYKKAATTLNVPLGSIGPMRARALERLRREITEDELLALLAT